MKKLLLLTLMLIVIRAYTQDHGFPYGSVTYAELDMKIYDKDSTAEAVVLDEFGEAYIDLNELNKLIFIYHVKIKILKSGGLKWADYEIPLRKFTSSEEILRSVKATSYNRSGNGIAATPLDDKNVLTDKVINKRYAIKKFAIPNVKVGSVIEVRYELHSPALFNFKSWVFQDEIPKVKSEYWASYPANYEYNIVLKGYQELQTNESKIIKNCVGNSGGLSPTAGADCSLLKFGMTNIPAFREEDHMTAPSNFLSGIYFELSVIREFNGAVRKFTREWKDVEQELKTDNDFGGQLRKARDVIEDVVEGLVAGEVDPIVKAKKIFAYVQRQMLWNEKFGIFTDVGVKKAFEDKKGNVADINLLLIAALQIADLQAEPLILSTRKNGLPLELHPVLTDFNYVIARVIIHDKAYFLDATDVFNLFGMLPEHCINGKGRALGAKQSYWVDLKPVHKDKHIAVYNLKLDKDGVIRGMIQNNYTGYEAMAMRSKIMSFADRSDYVKEMQNKHDGLVISNLKIKDLENFEAPLGEQYEIELRAFDDLNAKTLLFNPFLIDRWKSNPFKSNERLYPVDFGAPLEESIVFNLEYPDGLKVSELPPRVALSLPAGGGKYLVEYKNLANKLSVSSSFVIAKSVYTSGEYHFLKELFNRVVSSQNTDVVLEQ
jgi:hypothetical protein